MTDEKNRPLQIRPNDSNGRKDFFVKTIKGLDYDSKDIAPYKHDLFNVSFRTNLRPGFIALIGFGTNAELAFVNAHHYIDRENVVVRVCTDHVEKIVEMNMDKVFGSPLDTRDTDDIPEAFHDVPDTDTKPFPFCECFGCTNPQRHVVRFHETDVSIIPVETHRPFVPYVTDDGEFDSDLGTPPASIDAELDTTRRLITDILRDKAVKMEGGVSGNAFGYYRPPTTVYKHLTYGLARYIGELLREKEMEKQRELRTKKEVLNELLEGAKHDVAQGLYHLAQLKMKDVHRLTKELDEGEKGD